MVLFFGVPLVLTLLMTPSVMRLAGKYGCIDHPGGRRVHCDPTPRWGGLAFFAGVLPIFFFIQLDNRIISYLAASFLLVIVGAIDDWKQLDFKIKLLAVLAAITIVVLGGDVVVRDIGTYGSIGEIRLGVLAIPFTYLCIVGVTNAMNLIDGLNGLAGGISFIASLFMAAVAYLSGNHLLAGLCLAFAGAVGAFLRYNMLTRAHIFMGDSGSLFLGFSLSVFSIMLTQDPQYRVEPMFPVLVLLVPVFDTLRVMGVRLLSGRNPFKADTNHLHHLLLMAGFSPKKSVFLLWSLTTALGLAATLVHFRGTSTPYLIVVLTGSIFLSLFADSLGRRARTRDA
jgi:UDP-GlcNAc:undecaprenyl-phosphate/decaprenyl-phosphate GlcNAc-1-phosphate transferase